MKDTKPMSKDLKICFLIGLLIPHSTLISAQSSAKSTTSIPDIVRQIQPANIERTIRKLVSFGTRNTLSSQEDPNRGVGAARDYLKSEMDKISHDSGGRLKVELQSFTQAPMARIPRPTKLTNIVATLPGDLPQSEQRVVIVSGHYDSICSNPTDAINDAPGANDDASGTAAVVEIARVMSKYHFRATIMFLCVVGEEQGLLGSTYFAEQAKLSKMPIESMFTNDIIGGTLGGNGAHDNKTVRVFSEGIPSDETEADARTRRAVGGENDSPSRQLARFIKEVGDKYVSGIKVTLISRRDRYLRGGDHIPFNERGYSAVRFTEPNEDYHHQHQNVRTDAGVVYGDLPQFDDFPYIANVARINAASLAMLALAPAPPIRVGLVTRRLTEDTDLQWDCAEHSITNGYEIVWRVTSFPTWDHSLSVGNVKSYTMKGLSKDNFFFGVRSVDAEGHRSPVVYPRPAR